MKKITLDDVKRLPNGTPVFVKCTGEDWCLDDEDLNSWNIKQDDGLHYDDDVEKGVSFQYDFDYVGFKMDIQCFIEDRKKFCTDEFGNIFDLSKAEDVSVILNDIFSLVNEKYQCDCLFENINGMVKKAYENRLREVEES